MIVQLQVDGNELERDVHLLTDLDGLLQCQVICLNGLGEFAVVLVELSLGQEGVPHFSLSKILFCVLDLKVLLSQLLVEGLLDIHI